MLYLLLGGQFRHFSNTIQETCNFQNGGFKFDQSNIIWNKLNTIFHVKKESYELCMSLGKILIEAHVKNVFQGGAK